MDVMIDLETLGLGVDASIVQIGACYFDRNTGGIGDKFSVNISVGSSLKEGFRIDESTLKWWLFQDKKVIEKVFGNDSQKNVTEALIEFNNFLKHGDFFWSHTNFDMAKIDYHFQKLKIKSNIGFRSTRDIRTLVDLAKITDFSIYPPEGTAHTALDDCIYQIRYVVDGINKIKI